MSDVHANDGAPRSKFPLILNVVGGVLSLGLIALLIYWVAAVGPYDPNKVPVIPALEGQARVAPEKTEQDVAARQSLAVSAVAAAGEPILADEIALAPSPIDLGSDTDLVAIADVSAPVETDTDDLATSPYPKTRPIQTASATLAAPAPVATVAPGTKLIQLGAYGSNEIAQSQWDVLRAKHGDLLSGKERHIMVADTSNGRFYRLRVAGFENGSQSSAMCAILTSRGVACFPVTAK